MIKNKLIFQGFTNQTHADAIEQLFSVPDIARVLFSVAFITRNGVEKISPFLGKFGAKVTVFAGIRNDITSYQGIVSLMPLCSNLFIVDTSSRHIVFHPKLYLVRGAKIAKMLIGSANLTHGGLNNNIEASVLIEFDLSNESDRNAVQEIENLLDSLPESYPENILKITDRNQAENLLNEGRLVDESSNSIPKSSVSSNQQNPGVQIPKIRLKNQMIFANPTPVEVRPRGAVIPPMDKKVVARPKKSGSQFELVWQSKSLARRDLNIPNEGNTNKTGSINLDKGLLPAEIDHRHYFRDKVFSQLTWSSPSGEVITAQVTVELILAGVSHGKFSTVVRHTISTDTPMYLQKNAMTRLSWGPMKNYVADDNFIGRTLALYRDKDDPAQFIIEID